LSESVAEGTLASWKKKIGEAVARDEILIDIETDKVVLEVPSPGAGVLVEIVKGDGETVVSGELIARIDTEAKAGCCCSGRCGTEGCRAGPGCCCCAPAGTASPSARKILDEKGIAAADVAGSGRGGRVTKEDAVAAAPKAGPVAAPAAAKAAIADTAGEVRPRRPYRTARSDVPSACPYRRASAAVASKPTPS
jgi:2-oxoglutarate dehydrogenase E2 component (dihydrolipoamide succinyltransferase)